MTTVADASILAALYLDEPLSGAAEALVARETLIAPDLILAEVANALWRSVRRGKLAPPAATAALRSLPRHFERLHRPDTLAAAALALALRRDHPVYDCFYVAPAAREAAPLLTADRRLAERFGGEVEVRLPTA